MGLEFKLYMTSKPMGAKVPNTFRRFDAPYYNLLFYNKNSDAPIYKSLFNKN